MTPQNGWNVVPEPFRFYLESGFFLAVTHPRPALSVLASLMPFGKGKGNNGLFLADCDVADGES